MSDQNSCNQERKTRRTISDKIKQVMINHFLNGSNIATIAQMINYPRTTVSSIISKIHRNGTTNVIPRGGDFNTILSEDKKENIRVWVDKDVTLTLDQLVTKVREDISIEVSKSTIDRCLKNFHHTLKTGIVVPGKRNFEETIQKRYNYASSFNEQLLTFDDSRFIFIDKVGFSISLRTCRGRALVGNSAYIPVSAIISPNMSVVM